MSIKERFSAFWRRIRNNEEEKPQAQQPNLRRLNKREKGFLNTVDKLEASISSNSTFIGFPSLLDQMKEVIQNSNQFSWVWKIALCGDAAVGKTSIRKRYFGKSIPRSYKMSLGANFALKNVEMGGHSVKFQIWDIAGHPQFKQFRELYYSGCHGALIIFDLTRRQTFENLPKWINELWQFNGRGVVPIAIIGNKNDLIDQMEPKIIEDEVNSLLSELNEYTRQNFRYEVNYLTTSAKTGDNIPLAFQYLATHIVGFEWFKKS